MILSLETLEECNAARAILVEKHQFAQAEVGKYITHRNLAKKGKSKFRYETELADAEEFLSAVVEALRFVRQRIHALKFNGIPPIVLAMAAARNLYGADAGEKIVDEMDRITAEMKTQAINRPGLALEPIGNSGLARIRYL